jgi:hypothetical protein
MAVSGTHTGASSIGGVTAYTTMTRNASSQEGPQVTVAAPPAGTLSTRTDNDTGIALMAANHGLAENDAVDVYWDGGCRYGMNVTNVATDNVAIDAGSGKVLPSANTAVVVCKRTTVPVSLPASGVKAISLAADKRAQVTLLDNASTVLHKHIPAGEAYVWGNDDDDDAVDAHPLASNAITTAAVSSGDSTNGSTVTLGFVFNAS